MDDIPLYPSALIVWGWFLSLKIPTWLVIAPQDLRVRVGMESLPNVGEGLSRPSALVSVSCSSLFFLVKVFTLFLCSQHPFLGLTTYFSCVVAVALGSLLCPQGPTGQINQKLSLDCPSCAGGLHLGRLRLTAWLRIKERNMDGHGTGFWVQWP